jgi:hypothetical protein
LEVPLTVALLDYSLYVWHILVHKVPFLWRFHQPHHVDLDRDASTALRFHFGEILRSVPWRAAQIVVIGVPPLTLPVWQTATLVEILFHHSNVELPVEVERWLCRRTGPASQTVTFGFLAGRAATAARGAHQGSEAKKKSQRLLSLGWREAR